jgi:cytochrome P450
LIVDFDIFAGDHFDGVPQEKTLFLHDKPAVFYTPRNGGHWVVTGEEAAAYIVSRPEIFSANLPRYETNVPPAIQYSVPLHADPPEHSVYRRALAPLFSPAAMAGKEAAIRQQARELIDAVRHRGECEFVEDIARRFPIGVFLSLVGVAPGYRESLLDWADDIIRSPDPTVFERGTIGLVSFLKDTIAARRASPGDDVLSQLIRADFDGRAANDDTMLSLCSNLFVGGLDTVVSASAFILAYLASNPAIRQQLAAEPHPLRAAVVEELLRLNGVVTNARALTRDHDYNGVPFRKGERVNLMYQIMGMDPKTTAEPLAFDPGREQRVNLIFGMGAHRCVGVNLARLEIRVFVEEWLKAIPEFTLGQEALRCQGGSVWAPLEVRLAWDPAPPGSD